uniref:hypothetical protein n=1 Tax=Escherichia coli TaxID=562 RepID=UPI001FCE94F3
FIKSPVLCCGENITFHQVAKFSVPLHKLISLFRQFGGTELRLKLVWLCWLDLMTGNSLEDWKENLKRKSEKELEEWIINRQRQSAALTDLMDQYVLLAYRTTVDDSRN